MRCFCCAVSIAEQTLQVYELPSSHPLYVLRAFSIACYALAILGSVVTLLTYRVHLVRLLLLGCFESIFHIIEVVQFAWALSLVFTDDAMVQVLSFSIFIAGVAGALQDAAPTERKDEKVGICSHARIANPFFACLLSDLTQSIALA